MKKQYIFIDALLYALYMLVACVTCMFAEMLIVKVLDLLVPISYFALCIIRTAIYTLGVNAILCIIAYREGYKAAYCSVICTLISGIIATVIHFLFALLFGFEAFCSGGVRSITALVNFGSELASSSFMDKLTPLDFTIVFFINGLAYCAFMVIAKKLGATKRLSDRAALNIVSSDEEQVSDTKDSENAN